MDNGNLKEIKRYLKLRARAQERNNLKEESECCNVLGIEYLKAGDFEQALLMHMNELSISQSIQDVTGVAIANRNIGDVYVAMNKFEDAIKHHSKHLKLSQGNNVELQRANTSLGRTYLEYGRSIDDKQQAKAAYQKSAEMLKQSLKITAVLKERGEVSQKETNEMKIRSLINLGICYHQLSSLLKSKDKQASNERSKEYFEKALLLAKRFHFYEDLYLANYILTTVNTDQKQYSFAVRNAEAAVRLGKTIKKDDLLFQALQLSSEVHLMMENTAAAKCCLKKLYKKNPQKRDEIEPRLKTVIKMCHLQKDIESMKHDKKRLFSLHEALADLYCNMSCYYPALKHYKLQEALLEDLPQTTAQQRRAVYFSIASTLVDAGECDQAIDYYRQELACTNDHKEHTNTWTHIAICLEKKDADYHQVEEAFMKAAKAANQAGDNLLKLKTLISFEEVQRNYKEQQKAADTRSSIAKLETKLGICADELNEDAETETSENSCPLEDSEELFKAEMLLSDDDESDDEGPTRRRRRTNFGKTNEKGETQLHRACIEGQLKGVEVLIKQGHPINPRDFCGWIPLHEACNHGHVDIVELLLKHDANVNDTGGKHCDNITPINDAAVNGHFDVVETLLDHGADPNISNVQGKTALDSLVHYYQQHKEDLDAVSKRTYKKLYERLKDTGKENGLSLRNTNPSSDDVEECENDGMFNDLRSMGCALVEEEYVAPVIQRPRSSHSSKQLTQKNDCKILAKADDIPTLQISSANGHVLKKRNKNLGHPDTLTNDMGFVSAFDSHVYDRHLENEAVSKFRKISMTKRKIIESCLTPAALAAEDEIVDDDNWLVPDDDSFSQPIKRHRRSLEPLMVSPSTCRDWVVSEIPYTEAPFVSTSTTLSATHSSVQPVLQQHASAFRLKIKVGDKAFIFAVPGRDKSVTWLTEKAASRYKEVTGFKPVLHLSTSDGCLLSPDDAVCDVLNNNDTVVGTIESWISVTLSQQYVDACVKNRFPALTEIKQACESFEKNRVFNLPDCGYTFSKHLKPLIQCLGQQELEKLSLPGSRLEFTGVAFLCDSLNQPSPKPKTNLVELDLTCCGLDDEALKPLTACPHLQTVTNLNLSYNPICEGFNLKGVFQSLKFLNFLCLRSCLLSERTAENLDASGLKLLEELDLSKNNIGSNGVKSWLLILNRSNMKRLLLREVATTNNNHKLTSNVVKFLSLCAETMVSLDLSNNQLPQEDIFLFKSVDHLIEEVVI